MGGAIWLLNREVLIAHFHGPSLSARPLTTLSPISSLSWQICGAQELCESRGDRPGLPVLHGPYGLCGRNAEGPRFEPASALLSFQKLWSVVTVL